MTDYLTNLNKGQMDAILSLNEPTIVFAGPGTGKTRVVTHKIVHLVQEKKYRLEEVLALTFSEGAAQEMQDRVRVLLPGVPGINISTFHSFCYDLIKQYSLNLGLNGQGGVISQEHQQYFIYRNIETMGIKSFKVTINPVELAKAFQGAIARFKQENIDLEKLEKYIEKCRAEGKNSEELEHLEDLARVYKKYEEFKEERSLVDFGDMQLLAVDLLRNNPSILEKVRSKIKYVIVDEFQDTDFIQLQLIFLLAPEGNVTVVGDDDQSIYRFRGAYLTNIADFNQFYTNKCITIHKSILDINYRCSGNIQSIATTLIRYNPERQEKNLGTENPPGEPVSLLRFQNDLEQAAGITKKVIELHEKGVDYDHIAILVRRRVDAIPIIEKMQRNKIPVKMAASKDFFREPVIKACFSYLKVLQDPEGNQTYLADLMRRPSHGLLPGELQKLSHLAKDKKKSMWATLSDLDGYSGDREPLFRFKASIDALHHHYADKGLESTVRAITFEKDLFQAEISKGNVENVKLLNTFISLVSDYLDIYKDASLDDLISYLDVLSKIGIENNNEKNKVGTVNVMTVHKAKGREFPYVFIPCLNEKKFPSMYQEYKINVPQDLQDGVASKYSDEQVHDHEERRLFYVAISRGIKEVFLSTCKRYGENKKDSAESQFISEVLKGSGIKTIDMQVTIDDVDEPASIDGRLTNRAILNLGRGDWQGAVDAIVCLAKKNGHDLATMSIKSKLEVDSEIDKMTEVDQQPERAHAVRKMYSPSKLSTYENCPKMYYFQYVLEIPGEKKTYLDLGTNVHSTIESITRRMMEGRPFSVDEAISELDKVWKSSNYESEEKEKEDKIEAEKMIRDFLARQSQKKSKILDIEKWIEVEITGHRISCRVDRVDDVGGTLEVIDYKTSKDPKSKPELKKDIQMAMYKMGVEKTFGKTVSQVGHWNLRPDKETMVSISDEELNAVKERIIKIFESIENLSFPPISNYSSCKYCSYRNLCDDVY
jgi:DNA helicase-2/ATP-dependent DNA helicase PcrA